MFDVRSRRSPVTAHLLDICSHTALLCRKAKFFGIGGLGGGGEL